MKQIDLNNYWWHRLLRVLFFITIGLSFLIGGAIGYFFSESRLRTNVEYNDIVLSFNDTFSYYLPNNLSEYTSDELYDNSRKAIDFFVQESKGYQVGCLTNGVISYYSRYSIENFNFDGCPRNGDTDIIAYQRNQEFYKVNTTIGIFVGVNLSAIVAILLYLVYRFGLLYIVFGANTRYKM